jgi:hypothetical protein
MDLAYACAVCIGNAQESSSGERRRREARLASAERRAGICPGGARGLTRQTASIGYRRSHRRGVSSLPVSPPERAALVRPSFWRLDVRPGGTEPSRRGHHRSA